jgi:hypothetical protein
MYTFACMHALNSYYVLNVKHGSVPGGGRRGKATADYRREGREKREPEKRKIRSNERGRGTEEEKGGNMKRKDKMNSEKGREKGKGERGKGKEKRKGEKGKERGK